MRRVAFQFESCNKTDVRGLMYPAAALFRKAWFQEEKAEAGNEMKASA